MSDESHLDRAAIIFRALRDRTNLDIGAELQKSCGDDMALRRTVEQLLRGHASGDRVDAASAEVRRLVNESLPTFFDDDSEHSEDEIEGYSLGELLGQGGSGRVYAGRQLLGVERPVAIKILTASAASGRLRARFERERQTLAALEHPHIARIYDAGFTQGGKPFLAMELVPGAALTEHAKDQQLDLDARLQLFRWVCEAVGYAHDQGVIHRDLKPSNVLIREDGGAASPRVIDFGIAKLIAAASDEASLLTSDREMLGTPAYMAPEQAAGSAKVTASADVYALGLLLFELIAEKEPFDARPLRSRLPHEWAPYLAAVKIEKLSLAARLAIADDKKEPLDRVLATALAKEPEDRYQSASEFALAIEKVMKGERVTRAKGARSTGSISGRRGLTIVALTLALALGGVAFWKLRSPAPQSQPSAPSKAQLLAYSSEISEAGRALELGRYSDVLSKLQSCSPDLRGLEWEWLAASLEPKLSVVIQGTVMMQQVESQAGCTAGLDADGQVWVRVAGAAGAISCDLAAWKVTCIALSKDGRKLYGGTSTGELVAWACSTGERLYSERAHQQPVCGIFNTSGGDLWSGDQGGTLQLSSNTLKAQRQWATGFSLRAFALDHSEQYVALRTESGLRVGRIGAVLAELRLAKTDSISDTCVRSSGQNSSFAVGGFDGSLRLVDAASGEVVESYAVSQRSVLDVLAIPGSKRLLVCSGEGMMRVIDFGKPRAALPWLCGPGGPVALAWDAHRERALVGTTNGQVGTLPTSRFAESRSFTGHQGLVFEARAAGAHSMVSVGQDGSLREWNTDTGACVARAQPHGGEVYSLAVAPDGARVATFGSDKRIRIWELPGLKPLKALSVDRGVRNLAWHPRRNWLAGPNAAPDVASTTNEGGASVGLWDVESGRLLAAFPHQESTVLRLSFSPRGDRLAAPMQDGGTVVWDVATRQQLHLLKRSDGPQQDNVAAFAPDGQSLFVGHWDGSISHWDLAEGTLQKSWVAHVAVVGSLQMSADGRSVFSSGWHDRRFALWQAGTGESLLSIDSGIPGLSDAAWNSESRLLTVCGMDGGLTLWRWPKQAFEATNAANRLVPENR